MKDKKQSLSITIAPKVREEVNTLSETTGLSVSKIVEKALLDRLPVYKSDPGELLRKTDAE